MEGKEKKRIIRKAATMGVMIRDKKTVGGGENIRSTVPEKTCEEAG